MGTDLLEDFPGVFKILTEDERLAEERKQESYENIEIVTGRKVELIKRNPPEFFKLAHALAQGDPVQIEKIFDTNHRIVFLTYEHNVNLQAEAEHKRKLENGSKK